jgi:hypothetical protein
MQDSAMRVSTLTGEVKGLVRFGETHALFDKPFDRVSSATHNVFHHILMAQSSTCDERVLNMTFNGILVIDDGGYATLCPTRGSSTGVFGEYGHGQILWDGECSSQACCTCAQHQHIDLVQLWLNTHITCPFLSLMSS